MCSGIVYSFHKEEEEEEGEKKTPRSISNHKNNLTCLSDSITLTERDRKMNAHFNKSCVQTRA